MAQVFLIGGTPLKWYLVAYLYHLPLPLSLNDRLLLSLSFLSS